MGDKKRTEEWYEEINKKFEEDRKMNPEKDKGLAEMLDKSENESVEEWYERINKMYEEDAKTQDFSNPKMDKWFYGMLENERRKSKRRRIAGMAAGIALVFGIGTNVFTEVAYGESLIEIIKNSIEAGRFTITGFSKNDDSGFEDYDAPVIQYEADSIEEMFEKITNDTNIEELFYVTGLPEQYQQWEAKYNTEFQKLSINSHQEDKYFHIYEKLNYENSTSGAIMESESVSTVYNENLQMNISIVEQTEAIRCQGYFIEVFYDNKYLIIEGNATLEEFENIAKNISRVQGD